MSTIVLACGCFPSDMKGTKFVVRANNFYQANKSTWERKKEKASGYACISCLCKQTVLNKSMLIVQFHASWRISPSGLAGDWYLFKELTNLLSKSHIWALVLLFKVSEYLLGRERVRNGSICGFCARVPKSSDGSSFFQCCLILFCEPTFHGFLVISDWGACANLQF